MSRSRKARLPQEPAEATIDDLAHDGRGVAHIDGKAVFIHDALPGERVMFRYTARRSQQDEGQTVEVLMPSSERVTPGCAHFGLCGGCSLQHLDAEAQIHHKQQWLLSNLTRIGRVEPAEIAPPLTGPHWGYRYKARLGVKHVRKKGRVLVGFRERGTPYVADLQRCEVLHPRVGSLLPTLGSLIQGLSISDRLPQIEVAGGDDNVALNFRVLEPPTPEDLAALQAFGEQYDFWIYLQPKGPTTTYRLWPEQAELGYELPDQRVALVFEPYQFTQVNPALNRRMVNQALAWLEPTAGERVLDLFCGLGNFSLAIAAQGAEVVGVEGDEPLVAAARANAERNNLTNASFFKADLSQPVKDLPWAQQAFDKVLLDPPRSGALEVLPQIVSLAPSRIVYVSCHPATLARDVGELVHQYGYRLVRAGVMDMFPHTAHVESMALLVR